MKYSIVLLFVAMSFVAFSQTSEDIVPDARLYVKYQPEYIQNIMQNDARTISYMNFELDFGYFITDIGLEKCAGMPYLQFYNSATKTIGANVETVNESSINILDYYYERQYNRSSAYRIGNTGKCIVFKSLKDLNNEFNQN